LEFVDHPGSIALVDGCLRPFTEIDIPCRAVVVGDIWNTTDDVDRRTLASERTIESLSLRVLRAGGTIKGDREPLDCSSVEGVRALCKVDGAQPPASEYVAERVFRDR
jgi:hypothetical protein